MQDDNKQPHERPPANDGPAKAEGSLEGAPVDGVTADNPAHPKGEPGRDPPRPGTRSPS